MSVAAGESWRGWVASNLERGVATGELPRVMWEKGFSDIDARRCLADAVPCRSNRPSREATDACGGNPAALPRRIPGASRIDVRAAELFGYADFLSERECFELIELVRDHSLSTPGCRTCAYIGAVKPNPSGTRRIVHASVCVEADLDKPWPFVVEEHRSRGQEPVLMPGEALLYEGARLMRGRPKPRVGAA